MSPDLPDQTSSETCIPPESNEGRSPITVLRELKAGQLTGKQLSQEDRSACVEFLLLEGHSTAEVAEVLTISTRTVFRDKQTIRERNAIHQSAELAGQMAGRLLQETTHSINQLRKISRDRDCPHSVKVEAARSAVELLDRVIQRLQSLEFLPTAASRLHADVHQVQEGPPTFDVLLQEADRIRAVAQATGKSPEALEKLSHFRDLCLRHAAKEELQVVEAEIIQGDSKDD